MLGTVIVGMTCEDIGRLETNDIFRLVDTMMKQTGWTLRQVWETRSFQLLFSHGTLGCSCLYNSRMRTMNNDWII